MEDLVPVAEAAELLGFTAAKQGDLELTEHGNGPATATLREKKEIFRMALVATVNSARDIVAQLARRHGHRMSVEVMLDELERHFSFEEAGRQLNVLIDWGRYAEAYAFDELRATCSWSTPISARRRGPGPPSVRLPPGFPP